jgi:hypothetical protein
MRRIYAATAARGCPGALGRETGETTAPEVGVVHKRFGFVARPGASHNGSPDAALRHDGREE